MPRLTENEITEALQTLPGWEHKHNALHKIYTFSTFPNAIAFVVAISPKAEQFGHHPDMDIRYNRVFFALSTHDVGGFVTEKDLALARAIEEVAQTIK